MALRYCLDCRGLTDATRCPSCRGAHDRGRRKAAGYDQRYDHAWRKHSKQTREAWVGGHGPWCPGYRRPGHWVTPTALVVDHDIGVLCRACNGTKAATEDKRPTA